jgi:homocysteine S-methyltransferase
LEHPFRDKLRHGTVLVADGAMGTELYARGYSPDDCFELLNLDHPEVVEDIHRAYIGAGAEIVETNTFGANRAKLASFGLEDRVRDINVRGARLARGAREITGEPVMVAGSIGPTGWALEPYGSTTLQRVYDAFHEQVAGLLEGGVDLIVLETFGDLQEMMEAIRAVRDETDLPVIAQMTFAEDLRTPLGYSPEQVVRALSPLAVDVIGANCSVGSSSLLEVAERLIQAGAANVSAMPNAGWPMRVANRVLYLSSPEYMADYGKRMADAGVRIVGGCCGTTPVHIRALSGALRSGTAPRPRVEVMPAPEPEPSLDQFADQSGLVD